MEDFFESDHHYVRAAIRQRLLLNIIYDNINPSICDTLIRYFPEVEVHSITDDDLSDVSKFDYLLRKTDIIIDNTLERILNNHSNLYSRCFRILSSKELDALLKIKQYNVFEAEPIVEAHQYDQKHAYLEAKDDTVYILLKNNKPLKAMELGEQLLKEKGNAFGKNHPIYALALSDLAFLYLQSYKHISSFESITDSTYLDKAIELQTKAMKIYQNLHMPLSCRLSAQFLSWLYYWKGGRFEYFDLVGYQTSNERLQSLICLKQEELKVIKPILGNSTLEVDLAKKELEKLNEYIIKEDLYRKRHEDLFSQRFQDAIAQYNEGNYEAAKRIFADIKKEEERLGYKYLPIRKNYTLQWEAACYLQLGDTLTAKNLDAYCELGPVDRSKTLELDYLCTFEPSNPTILPLLHDSFSTTPLLYVRMLLQTGNMMIQSRQFDCASKCLLNAKSICKDLFGESTPLYALILNQLGDLYISLHYDKEAVVTLEESLSIEAKIGQKNTKSYQTILDKIIKIYENGKDKQDYAKWKQEKLQTDESLDVKSRCQLMYDIAEYFVYNAHLDSTNILKAIEYLKLSMASMNKEDEHLNSSYALLAYCYSLLGRTDDLRCLVEESLESLLQSKIQYYDNGKLTGIDDIMKYSGILREIYFKLILYINILKSSDQFDYQMELAGYAKVIRNELKRVRFYSVWFLYNKSDHVIDVATCYNHFRLKNYKEVVQIMQKAMRLREEMDGKRSDKYYSGIQCLLPSLYNIGNVEEAASLLREWWQFKSDNCLTSMALMNGTQRESFWNNNKKVFEETIPLFALRYYDSTKGSLLYDNVLLCKGLLLNTEMEIDRLITQKGDQRQIALYHQLHNGQLMLMAELQKPIMRAIDTDSLQAVLRTLEHTLLISLQEKESADIVQGLRVSWEDIKKHLKEDDIAVEFMSVPKGKDDIQYYALTLRKDYGCPHLIQLFTQKELTALKPKDYYGSTKLFNMLWLPLANELQGVKNVYFSPTESLHQIGIEYLPGMEQYNTYRLSSTRELVKREYNSDNKLNAVIYGGLKFELTDDERNVLTDANVTDKQKTFRDTPDLTSLRELRGAVKHMPILEGSRKEVNEIDSLMRRNKIPVSTVTGILGTEESFKALSGKGKSLIHISTHGFYQTEPTQSTELMENEEIDQILGKSRKVQSQEDLSLSRSGLLLTGAADYIFGRVSDYSTEDGILTAREISRLDLKGLDLVVLSACETGLGDISGEGVFGLQRGFKKAGAQTLLVSLWKVEDDATQLLMTEFYRNYLSGQTKRKAFSNAQQTLRQAEGGRFDRYECWAAFVMIDGLK